MSTLRDCLANTPRRTLLVMAQLHGLAPKDELVETVSAALLQPGHIRRILLQLTDGERAVLTAMLATDNRRPLATFECCSTSPARSHPAPSSWTMLTCRSP